MGRSDLTDGARPLAVVAVFATAGILLARMASGTEALLNTRLLVGGGVLAVMLGLVLVRLSYAVVAFLAYSAIVGSVRRLTPAADGDIDALLVSIPVVTIVIAAIQLRRGAMGERTARTNLVMFLLLLAVGGVLNPLQGAAVVGGVGLAFFGVPMLWFFVGRSMLADREFTSFLWTVAIAAVPIGIYGLFQSNDWFLASERELLSAPGGAGSFLDGKLRPIGTMASTGEFARFSMVAAMVWLVAAAFSRPRRLVQRWAVVPFALLLTAAILSGVRVSIVTSVVTLGLIVAAASRLKPLQAGALGVVSVLAVVVGLQFASQQSTDIFIVDRQLSGLSDVTGPESTSLQKRIVLARDALSDLPTHPLGQGTGLTTPAGSRFGNRFVTTETDLGDVAASWGVPGLIAYSLFLAVSLQAGYEVARARRDFAALGALAVVGVALSQWMNGGLYAVAPIVWLSLGWIDRQALMLRAEQTEHNNIVLAEDQHPMVLS